MITRSSDFHMFSKYPEVGKIVWFSGFAKASIFFILTIFINFLKFKVSNATDIWQFL